MSSAGAFTAIADPAAVIERALERGVSIATAESLTAGAVVARLVDVPGASAVIAGGAACYTEAAKTRVLGVPAAELERNGAVTAGVAAAMAQGARELYDADLAVSTTGVAGPGPDARGVAAGTVWIGLARRDGETSTTLLHLDGDRSAVRTATVAAAITELRAALD